MDLNRLYFDHQVSLMHAARPATCAMRRDHVLRASRIAGRIGSVQRALGAKAASAWESLALRGTPATPPYSPLIDACVGEPGMRDRP